MNPILSLAVLVVCGFQEETLEYDIKLVFGPEETILDDDRLWLDNQLQWYEDEGSRPAPPDLDPDALVLVWTTESAVADSILGRTVAGAGDLNGDGFDDLAVAADDPETGRGRIYIYAGSPGGASASPTWTLEGGPDFGHSLAGAGDVNGDGYDDLIVGAYSASSTYLFEGVVHLYLGSPTGPSLSWERFGGEEYAAFGWSAAAAGDVNGDGFDDIVASAPWIGRVCVFHGSPAGLPESPSWTYESGYADERLGSSVAGAGDVNGDGFDDVIVGAERHTGSAALEGRALVFLGSAAGLAQEPSWIAVGGSEYALFGASVAGAGDFDGDGFDDVLIGAPTYEGEFSEEGLVRLYRGSRSGPSIEPSWTATGGRDHALFGAVAARAGDLDGDGFADIVVGSPGYSGDYDEAGAAFVYFGPTGSSGWYALGSAPGESYAVSVASAGDPDGDGRPAVAIGAPYRVNGAVFVYASPTIAGADEGTESESTTTPAQGAEPSIAGGRSHGSRCFAMTGLRRAAAPWAVLALLALVPLFARR